jgi:hypothetical protein
MNVILVGILGLRKVSENKKGVAIVTQPLSGKGSKVKNGTNICRYIASSSDDTLVLIRSK